MFPITLRDGTAYMALICRRRYDQGGGQAVLLVDAESGDQIACLSVNVEGASLPDPEMWVAKTYSENQGLLEQLEALGLAVREPDMRLVGMAGPQPICRLTEDAADHDADAFFREAEAEDEA